MNISKNSKVPIERNREETSVILEEKLGETSEKLPRGIWEGVSEECREEFLDGSWIQSLGKLLWRSLGGNFWRNLGKNPGGTL